MDTAVPKASPNCASSAVSFSSWIQLTPDQKPLEGPTGPGADFTAGFDAQTREFGIADTRMSSNLEPGEPVRMQLFVDRSVIEEATSLGVAMMPGCHTPTEMLTAWEAGADLVKVFPASVMGPGYLKAVLAPLPHLRLVPTGGVSADNATEYIKAGATALGVGGKLVDKAIVARGDWAAITAEAARLVEAVRTTVG